jgi:peptidoglycan-associated lipoprotein
VTTQTRNTLTLAAGFVALIAIVGCSSDAPEKKSGMTSLAGPSTPDVAVSSPSAAQKSFVENNHMQTVYFAQNEWMLNDEAKEIVKKNVDWLNENPLYRLEIDGYADSRGTPEEALAMSQRRAAALRNYYAALGIPKNRIATIAFGETNPVCVQDSEDCWKQNRRAETLIENKSLAER